MTTRRKSIGEKTVQKGKLPDFSQFEDLTFVESFGMWLAKQRDILNKSFRSAQDFEHTCRLQGKAELVDELLSKFSNHLNIKGENDDRQTERKQDYEC